MTVVEWLNFTGLLLNFVGGLTLFKYGPPQPSFEEGSFLRLDMETDEEKADNERVRKLKAKHIFTSKAGLLLIAIGFLLQLGAARPICALAYWTCAATP